MPAQRRLVALLLALAAVVAPMVAALVVPDPARSLDLGAALRVLPVRLTDFSITEEAFDPNLNPIRAKVSLGMRVLTVNDLGFAHKGGSLFMSYLQTKEQLAAKAQAGSFAALGIGGIG